MDSNPIHLTVFFFLSLLSIFDAENMTSETSEVMECREFLGEILSHGDIPIANSSLHVFFFFKLWRFSNLKWIQSLTRPPHGGPHHFDRVWLSPSGPLENGESGDEKRGTYFLEKHHETQKNLVFITEIWGVRGETVTMSWGERERERYIYIYNIHIYIYLYQPKIWI